MLIVAQLCWKAYLLSRFYFRQDDFLLLDRALSHGLSLNYLFRFSGGHLRPGGLAVFWLVTRLSPYDWLLASIMTIAALAAAGVLMLRLLLILFGSRPAILIPLIIFLFTPLTLAGLSFWTTVTDWLPLQLTMLAATYSHVRYVRSGRVSHVVAAAVWLGAGLLFDVQGVLVPLLLFALTSAYLVPGRWPAAARRTLRSFRRAWTIYGVLTAAYLVFFFIKLQTSSQQPINPRHVSSVLSLAAAMLRVGFVPAAVGGPWRWFVPGGDYGFAAETPVLTQVTWVLAALIVSASLWYRRHALRSWLILAGWLLTGRLRTGRDRAADRATRQPAGCRHVLPGRLRTRPCRLCRACVLACHRRAGSLPRQTAAVGAAGGQRVRPDRSVPGGLDLVRGHLPQQHIQRQDALVHRHCPVGAS